VTGRRRGRGGACQVAARGGLGVEDGGGDVGLVVKPLLHSLQPLHDPDLFRRYAALCARDVENALCCNARERNRGMKDGVYVADWVHCV
jgi:hypothetical protein